MHTTARLLPLGAMAHRLRVAAKWLRAEAESGRIPHLNAGGRLLFEPHTVEALLLERARGQRSAQGTASVEQAEQRQGVSA